MRDKGENTNSESEEPRDRDEDDDSEDEVPTPDLLATPSPPPPSPPPPPRRQVEGKKSDAKTPAAKPKAQRAKTTQPPSRQPPTPALPPKPPGAQAKRRAQGQSAVPQHRKSADQEPADLEDARGRSRRKAAVDADAAAYDDVSQVGPNVGDADGDGDYKSRASGDSDDEDLLPRKSRKPTRNERTGQSKIRRQIDSDEEEDELRDDDGIPSASHKRKRAPADEGDGEFDNRQSNDRVTSGSARGRDSGKASRRPERDPLDDDDDDVVIVQPGTGKERGTNPSWSSNGGSARNATKSSSRGGVASGSTTSARARPKVDFVLGTSRRGADSGDDGDVSDAGNSQDPGPSASPRQTSTSSEAPADVIELTDSEKEDNQQEDTQQEESGKGKGKGKAIDAPPPTKKKRLETDVPAMVPGGPIVIRDTPSRPQVLSPDSAPGTSPAAPSRPRSNSQARSRVSPGSEEELCEFSFVLLES